MWVKKCVEIYVILFKMKKCEFEIGNQTSPNHSNSFFLSYEQQKLRGKKSSQTARIDVSPMKSELWP